MRSGDSWMRSGVEGSGWQAEPCLNFPACAMAAYVDKVCCGAPRDVGAGVAGLWAGLGSGSPLPSGPRSWQELLVSAAQPSSGRWQKRRAGSAGYVPPGLSSLSLHFSCPLPSLSFLRTPLALSGRAGPPVGVARSVGSPDCGRKRDFRLFRSLISFSVSIF